MQYCPRCQRLCIESCPGCGKRRGLRPPEPNDPVLLIEADAMQTMLIEPILEQSGVPYAKTGEMGAARRMYAGLMTETYSFFVPFSAWEDCRALLEEAFDPDGDIASALHQYDPQGE